uniref:receptor tyrosine-protein kinase erbB-4 n=1 Tax=Ciona intestinalis TaxID=7719 RepID=UPI00089DBC12
YLKIVSWPGNLTDFSIFENLEQIDGFNLYKDLAALVIQDNVHANGPSYLMQIQSLGFRSLRAINHGNVYIGYLRNLCFDKAVNWTSMIKDPQSYRGFLNGILLRKNKPASQCNVSSLCDEQCNSNGCWGFGPTQCLQCKNFSFNGTCLSTCHKEMGITFADGENECVRCHSQCKDTCRGIGPRNCTECLVYDHNGTCTDECPMDKYPHPVTKTCERCHSFCAVHRGDPMCFGPNNTLGENGCHRCYTALTTRGFDVTQCMPAGAPCPTGYFIHDSSSTLILERQTCMPCYEGCNNCTGVAREDCLHALSSSQEFTAAIVVPVAVVVCALLFSIFFGCRYRRKQIQKKRTQSMRKLGIDPHSPEEQNMDPRVRLMEPMTPSGVAPNQAQLRIVKEAELRIGKILGSGAFGTVHKGYWIPDLAPRERVKVPVAIKVLRDESSQVASNEILDEAFVMASCEHPNLVRLLGISLSQRIMLITQLMPLGNLLEYVRDNKDNIGSQHLLNWSLQIAKGMKYLSEEKHLVHRDLAARNVLVKSPNHVRITDFGLAKLLDVKEDVYRAEGGKMPIKWLALESIQHRIFTQKSDVWSFGVTMWELMTFGKKPYESVPAREVHTLLERGERLPQPYICTIDIYMLLIKCWTVDAEARPTFKELTEELSKLARDPQRYLVIDNDGLLTDLPSPTTSEFLRSLVNDEGDDFPITDAEEYLHPQPLEGTENPLNSNQFSLQPVPTMVPWKRQHHQQHLSSTSSQQGLLGSRGSGSGRFVHPNRSADRRLDSVMTTMTNLSSVSGSLPNGASTPFSPVAMGLNPEDDDDREVVLGATGDSLQGPIIHYNALAAPDNFRSFSESSDAVFAPSPLIKHDRGYRTNRMDEGCSTPEQQSRYLRAREDSTTMRYSAEPVSLMRQQTKPNEKKPSVEKLVKPEFLEDEEGYLSPSVAANKKPEYLDPSEFPPSPFALKPPVNIFDSVRTPTSALANPEYEPSFVPSDCESGTAGNTQDTFDEDDREYQNIVPNGVTVIPDQHQLQIGLRRGSQSEESVNSEKRDSGLQTDEEDDKKALDVKATSVANPEYDYLGDVTSGGSENPGSPGNNQNSPPSPNFVPNETEYINDSVAPKSGPNHQNGFAEDEIFSALTLADPKMRERVLYGKNSAGRTYSEPDSGVGIEVAMDNILYHKLGPNWDTTE